VPPQEYPERQQPQVEEFGSMEEMDFFSNQMILLAGDHAKLEFGPKREEKSIQRQLEGN